MTIVTMVIVSILSQKEMSEVIFQNLTNVQRLQTQQKTLDVVSAQLYH